MSGEKIFWMHVHELSEQIGNGDLSPVDVVEALLQRIDSINPNPKSENHSSFFIRLRRSLPKIDKILIQ